MTMPNENRILVLQGGGAFNAFPSGHMATSCAVLAVLWLWYPRFRILYLMAGIGVAVDRGATRQLNPVIGAAVLAFSGPHRDNNAG